MNQFEIDLKTEKPITLDWAKYNFDTASLIVSKPNEVKSKTAVLIIPGGGYSKLALDHEGKKVAEWLNSIGITAFILKYRHKSNRYPAPLNDAQKAILMIKSNLVNWNIDIEKIGVIGFSAGGHLAGLLITQPIIKNNINSAIDFGALIYPVVTLKGIYSHQGSFNNLLSADFKDQKTIDSLCLENRISTKTPPVFLIHSEDDKGVPVENSLELYKSLRKYKIPVEFHIFEKGGHGYGMRKNNLPCNDWNLLLEKWLRSNSFI